MENIINRTVLLYGEITTELIKDVVLQITDLLAYDHHMENTVVGYEREPIFLNICSEGGSVSPSIGLCELILHSPSPIVGTAFGLSCSAAFMILICCHYRLATKGSTLMAHHMFGGIGGSTKDCKIAVSHWEKLDQYMIGVMKDHTKIPVSLIEEIYDKQIDKYFTVEEALELGIIDDIYGQEKIGETDDKDDSEEESEPANI